MVCGYVDQLRFIASKYRPLCRTVVIVVVYLNTYHSRIVRGERCNAFVPNPACSGDVWWGFWRGGDGQLNVERLEIVGQEKLRYIMTAVFAYR